VNTRGSNSFLDCYSAVNRYTGYISIANLEFASNKPGLNLVIFVLSIGGVLTAF
jgi:hypothetical protein